MHSSPSITGQTVAVFGAANGWGKNFADILVPRAGHIFRVDPALEAQGDDPAEAISKSDAILFAVSPDAALNGIVADHHKCFHPQKIILECATTKKKITKTLHSLDADRHSVCSLHPMAKPDTPSRGQNMLVMPVGKNGERAGRFGTDIAALLQMNPVTAVRFEQHALIMSLVQGVDHILQRAKMIALSKKLSALALPFSVIRELASANFRINELGTGRVAIQPEKVSSNIISEMRDDPQAWSVMEDILVAIETMRTADEPHMQEKFLSAVDVLDHDESWRRLMKERTERILRRIIDSDL